MASLQELAQEFKRMTSQFIAEKSYQLDGVPGTRVDIICNVVNMVAVHWVADYLVNLPATCFSMVFADTVVPSDRHSTEDEGQQAGSVH